MLLHGTFVSGYYEFRDFTGVNGYQVFLLQAICQERKPQIDIWILSVVHILDPNIHCYSPKTEAIN